jgi:hypothetical protein
MFSIKGFIEQIVKEALGWIKNTMIVLLFVFNIFIIFFSDCWEQNKHHFGFATQMIEKGQSTIEDKINGYKGN